ncbi:Uncharacterised protein [Mycobacteroides abscessus subsp. abscessus]|uniref:DUF4352 domain-containing protein n=4 Tax=Mycobacteroides abscessus TaxID=36809 RepID=A0A829PQA3_9MYCO|nr:hypothetical protein [Mycobacteroides abscessus]ETZ89343.1 hypothetical protein L829_2919 [Mycobacteroides abscessus MAB_030201_1075]ETZ95529.1 hypothetical protein L828_0045 [Mycobacteroides abscessus MAB_030201_1061]EUA46375.1 hypothetical protein I543_2480 [Mycobacteroides abscessus 21]AMU70432.1 hypothetical protein A3O05_10540 [Mycobacteroides abscessus]EIC69266.1 hypothetical protein OUW_00220 [Mycobacteroides abscessus M93]
MTFARISATLSPAKISSPLLRVLCVVIIAALFLSASVFVWRRLPTAPEIQNAFDVHGTAGSTVSGRLFSISVSKVAVAPVVKHTGYFPKQRNIRSLGQWVIIKATVTSLVDAPMANATLEIGDNAYRPDDRLQTSTLDGAGLAPLIPQTGVYVFEVGTEDLNRAASGKLYISAGEFKWDSRLVVDVPLDPEHAPRASVVALPKTVVGQP